MQSFFGYTVFLKLLYDVYGFKCLICIPKIDNLPFSIGNE